VGRSAAVNHLNRKLDELEATTKHPALKAFLPQNSLAWIAEYLKFALTPRYPFPSYAGTGHTGLYQLTPSAESGKVKIAIAGDWGTGTDESEKIASLMSATEPDLTVHLGDVYYVGGESEIAENCFGRGVRGYAGVTWPHGSQGSFALNGNHEMYANGKPYFTTFLSSLGMKNQRGGQITSFFCLEAGAWRIIALDTGYNSVGVPILSQIPGINSIPVVGGDCHLEKTLIDWLAKVVRPKDNIKPTLLLSHHQYYTAFKDRSCTKPAKQLVEFFDDQETVWIWGHEHRLGVYDKFQMDGGITAYGRCVGHGGMPVDLGTPNTKKAPLVFYDPREHPLDNGAMVGENGFVTVTIQGDLLTLEYRDIANRQLLVESFRPGNSGTLQYDFEDPPVVYAKI